MKSIILLMEKNTMGVFTINSPIKAFTDWDWATLQCAKYNQIKKSLIAYYLHEISFAGDIDSNDFWITRKADEICINGPDDSEVYAIVKLEATTYEEHFHEEAPTEQVPTYEVDTIIICGTELKNLKLSDELVRSIEHEADNYKEEMIENINNSSNFED